MADWLCISHIQQEWTKIKKHLDSLLMMWSASFIWHLQFFRSALVNLHRTFTVYLLSYNVKNKYLLLLLCDRVSIIHQSCFFTSWIALTFWITLENELIFMLPTIWAWHFSGNTLTNWRLFLLLKTQLLLFLVAWVWLIVHILHCNMMLLQIASFFISYVDFLVEFSVCKSYL